MSETPAPYNVEPDEPTALSWCVEKLSIDNCYNLCYAVL